MGKEIKDPPSIEKRSNRNFRISKAEKERMDRRSKELQNFLWDKNRISAINSALKQIKEELEDGLQSRLSPNAIICEGGTLLNVYEGLYATHKGLKYNPGSPDIIILMPIIEKNNRFFYKDINVLFKLEAMLYHKDQSVTGEKILRKFEEVKDVFDQITY